MMFSRSYFASKLRNVGKNILPAPTESMCHEQDEALAVSIKTMLSVRTHLLFDGIIWPATNWVLIES